MADFSGWTDMDMKWGDADTIRLNDIWIMLEMFRQAIIERCQKVYPILYYGFHNSIPEADEWKNMLSNQAKMLNEFSRIENIKNHIDTLNTQLNTMMRMPTNNYSAWGHFKGDGSYIDFNDGQAASNVRWEEPADGETFHVEQLKTTYGYVWDVELPTPVLVSLDATMSGNKLSLTDVTIGTHSYGAPHTFSVKPSDMTRDILVALTDPDNIDWYAQLSKPNAENLRKWFNQFYHMLNLLLTPSVGGRLGYGTTVGMEGSTEDDYQENIRSASVDCWGTSSWAYWTGMTEEDWENCEGLSLSEAWNKSKWTGQNGCAYGYHPDRSYYDENDPSMGYSEEATRRRQWFKLTCGNAMAFKDKADVRAKQEMYLTKHVSDTYLNEIGAENSWVTLCDMLVPMGDNKSVRIESGNIDGMPGNGGWEAELRRITITAEVDMGSALDLKFRPEE